MFKKLVVASAILAASTGAFAGKHHSYKGECCKPTPAPCCAAPAPATPPCCPTLSICGPYMGFAAGLRNNYTRDPSYFRGIEGTLSLGYGATWASTFYLAGEVFVQGTANVSNQTNTLVNPVGTGAASARSTWGYGLSVLPGVMINDLVLGYVRLGAVRSRFNDAGSNATGGTAGLGIQTVLCGNWDMRMEYDYTMYGHINNAHNPRSDEVTLGLVYKFA